MIAASARERAVPARSGRRRSVRTRRAGWGAALLALVLTAGCGVAPGGPSSGPFLAASSAGEDLQQARRQAGIEDCPASSSTVAARADGLPDVTLECLGGGSSVRLAGLRGTPMVVNVWAQWCPPCRAESPHLREFAQRAGTKVALLGIDYSDPRPDLAIEFAGLVGWKHPQVVDPRRVLEGPLRLGTGIPVTLLVDAEGRIVHRVTGQLTSTQQLVELVADKLGVRL